MLLAKLTFTSYITLSNSQKHIPKFTETAISAILRQ